MQNPISKFRQSSIISEKPGCLFVGKIENFDELQLPYSLSFFTKILHTFSA